MNERVFPQPARSAARYVIELGPGAIPVRSIRVRVPRVEAQTYSRRYSRPPLLVTASALPPGPIAVTLLDQERGDHRGVPDPFRLQQTSTLVQPRGSPSPLC